MKAFTNEDLKALLSSNDFGTYSALEIEKEGFRVVSSSQSVLEENQVDLSECVFWFSGNFNDEKVSESAEEANLVYNYLYN